MKTDLHISGLKNLTSTAHIEKTIESFPRVQAVQIDPERERAIVEHEGADLAKIRGALAEAGLQVSPT